MTSPRIQVTIIGDSAAASCEGECTTDWMKADNQETARAAVAKRIGEDAALEFLEVSGGAADSRQKTLISHVRSERLPFPVLMLNGNARINGPFDLRMLIDVIEAEMDRDL